MKRIPVYGRARRRAWNAMGVAVSGSSGLVVIPVWARDTAPYVGGAYEPQIQTPHSDDTEFDDGAEYTQGAISVQAADAVAIGATSIRLKLINADPDLVGVMFSYQHAPYKTGPASLIDGDYWTVPIFPAVRAAIPAGATLEFDNPTCLCRLVNDTDLDIASTIDRVDFRDVQFVEAMDYWSDLAAGVVDEVEVDFNGYYGALMALGL